MFGFEKKQMPHIERVAVIGAGVMGAKIAAQIANAGVPVDLFDIVPENAGTDRSVLARKGIEKALQDKQQPPFMHPNNARRITPCNLEDDLARLRECDWIIEAVKEDIKVKKDIFKKIEPYRKKGSIVSSNTSTIPLKDMAKGMDRSFQKDFTIAHFFNPPRYMRLLEIVGGEKTRPEALDALRDFADIRLGKGVVECHDTPGFIDNRLGVFMMQAALNEALEKNVSVEVADAVLGRPAGLPKTGIFGLLDLVGIDLVPHLAESFLNTLPADDSYCTSYKDHPLIGEMIAAGYNGRKGGKGGFYRLDPDAPKGTKVKQALDFSSGHFDETNYRPAEKVELKSVGAGRKGLRAVFETNDEGGRYARAVLGETLRYAASLVPEIADDILAVDEAMKLGYNWKNGPFEMIDALGADWFAKALEEDGKTVPPLLRAAADKDGFYKDGENGARQYLGVDGTYQDVPAAEGVLSLADLKRRQEPLERNNAASLHDVGNGVLCVELHGVKDSLDPETMAMLNAGMDTVRDSGGAYKAMLIHSEGQNFAVGANLGLVSLLANSAQFDKIGGVLAEGQATLSRLKYAPFPVVPVLHGMALGGGAEIALHGDARQMDKETYIGLVEQGIGIVPGWGGCKEFLIRTLNGVRLNKTPATAIMEAFETIAMAKVSSSAQEARSLRFAGESDGITMNPARLLADAKKRALDMAEGYEPPEPTTFHLPGSGLKTMLLMSLESLYDAELITYHDVPVAAALADVLTGGPEAKPGTVVTEDDILRLERAWLIALLKTPETRWRITSRLNGGLEREEPLACRPAFKELLATTHRPVALDALPPIPATWPSADSADKPSAAPAAAEPRSLEGKSFADKVQILLEDYLDPAAIAPRLPEGAPLDKIETLTGAFREEAEGTRQKTMKDAKAQKFFLKSTGPLNMYFRTVIGKQQKSLDALPADAWDKRTTYMARIETLNAMQKLSQAKLG